MVHGIPFSIGALVLMAVTLLDARTADAISINFNTHANGSPFVGLADSFPASEFAALGVTINDSDPTPGSTDVNLTDPLNVGTAISGYYVNVGAFAGTPTSLDLDFSPLILAADFDFATFSGALAVDAFGAGGAPLGTFSFSGSGTFINQAHFALKSGHGSLSGIGPISELVVRPNVDEGLIFDNLNFRPAAVSEPGSLELLWPGLVALGLIGRRLIVG